LNIPERYAFAVPIGRASFPEAMAAIFSTSDLSVSTSSAIVSFVSFINVRKAPAASLPGAERDFLDFAQKVSFSPARFGWKY
jgi:hypothetical protein